MTLKAIVLAGGAGRRFGGSKLTTDYEGRPLLTYALDAALDAPVRQVVVVTGFHAEAVGSVVRRHASAQLSTGRLTLAHAADAEAGMAASLRAGLSALRRPYDAVFVFLGDMPHTPTALPAAMAAALDDAAVGAVVPVHEGRRGHPVLFRETLTAALRACVGDEGGRAVLRSLGPRCAEIAGYGPGVLEDVDFPPLR